MAAPGLSIREAARRTGAGPRFLRELENGKEAVQRRPELSRKRITEGLVSCLIARRVAKSASAETTILSSCAARANTASSVACCRL